MVGFGISSIYVPTDWDGRGSCCLCCALAAALAMTWIKLRRLFGEQGPRPRFGMQQPAGAARPVPRQDLAYGCPDDTWQAEYAFFLTDRVLQEGRRPKMAASLMTARPGRAMERGALGVPPLF
jgi:hypothetical protein